MCGIAGFYCKTGLDNASARALGRAMLFYAAERGTQSAGAWIDGRHAKRAVEPLTFADSDDCLALYADAPVKLAMFHTRMPTSGGRDHEHAQPFVHGEVATVHNGVIRNETELRTRFEIDNPSGVDSELVTSYVAKHGVGKLSAFLEAVSGCAALGIVVDGRLYLARRGNPLHTLELTLPGAVTLTAFASTESILLSALRYVYLLRPTMRTSSLAENQAYRVKSTGLTCVGRIAKPEPWADWDGDRYQSRGYVSHRYTADSIATMLAAARAEAAEFGATIDNANEYGFWLKDATRVETWVRFAEFAAVKKLRPSQAPMRSTYNFRAQPNRKAAADSKQTGYWEDLGNGSRVWRPGTYVDGVWRDATDPTKGIDQT